MKQEEVKKDGSADQSLKATPQEATSTHHLGIHLLVYI